MKYRKKILINSEWNIEQVQEKLINSKCVESVNIENNELLIISNIKLMEEDILDLLNKKEEDKIDEFYFDEIDCPNCANKVEVALNKSSLIKEANVVFLSNKIIIKHNEEDIFKEVETIVKSIEKDTNIYRNKNELKTKVSLNNLVHHHEHEEGCCCDHHHEHNEECSCDHQHKKECCCHEEKHEHHHNHHEGDEHDCCCNHHAHRRCNNKKNMIFSQKTAFIVGCILFGIATILNILGNEELLKLFDVTPLISGNGYLIPLFILYITSYTLLAYDLIYKSIYGILHKDYFNESLLMVIASLGAIVLSFIGDIELFEACAVVLLYKIGESLQDKATKKSKDAIKELIDLEIEEVTLTNGIVKQIEEVKIGERILVKVGEKVPLDGIICEGKSTFDMKALTGESEPLFKKEDDELLSGSINLTNVVTIEVKKEYKDSTLSKVKKIVEEANEKKSSSEQFITKFARVYTPIVLCISLIVLVILLICHKTIQEALNSVFAILVISCPCSLVISIPLAYFAALGSSSKHGILVKGGNYLEALTNIEKIIFDKTGTITEGEFEIVSVKVEKGTEEELLNIASMVESFSNHPIAKSICKGNLIEVDTKNSLIEEISGYGLKMEHDGDIYLVGNDKLMIEYSIEYVCNEEVGTAVYVAKNNEFLGSIIVRDKIKDSSKNVIEKLHDQNIDTLMLTGDKKVFGEFVAKEVGIKDVKSELLPQEKYTIVDEMISHKKKNIVYVGDGINDTPSLRRADVGIALGGIGSDLAKESADIVIMNDDISKVNEIIKISKFTKGIIIQNLVFILLTKIIAMVISITGILDSYAMLIAIFADVGVCLLCVLNSLRVLYKK